MQSHDEKVRNVAQQLKAAAKKGVRVEFVKKSVSHLVPNPYADPNETPKIDLSPLDELLDIDEKNLTCTAESGLTFEYLTRATLAKGLIPNTVSELKGITIGGAVSGCSVESMSYKDGGFHDSCLEYEVITGEGEVIICSREKDPEIFEMMHGSYGTLGVISKIKFKLLPAKSYVKMEYHHHSGFDEFWTELRERCEKADYEFVDAIIHSPTKFVICLGQMVDDAPYVSNYEWLNIYYKSTATRTEDYLSTQDYFFRYDAECHWLTRTTPVLENKLVRLLVGKIFLGSTNLITWSNRLRHILKLKKRPEVVVDVFIPSKRFKEFYQWYESDFDFFPLWIVPYRVKNYYPWLSKKWAGKMDDKFLIDCAVYGKANNDPRIDYSDLMEKKVYDLGGIKTLISRNHYDEQSFWEIYCKPTYDDMKKRLDPGNVFDGLYERFAPAKFQKEARRGKKDSAKDK
jgi:FAD binding domain